MEIWNTCEFKFYITAKSFHFKTDNFENSNINYSEIYCKFKILFLVNLFLMFEHFELSMPFQIYIENCYISIYLILNFDS